MEKFIVKSQEKRAPVKFKPVQMYEDTHEMVEFAFKHIEIVKEGE